jgi:hypothetical protein
MKPTKTIATGVGAGGDLETPSKQASDFVPNYRAHAKPVQMIFCGIAAEFAAMAPTWAAWAACLAVGGGLL